MCEQCKVIDRQIRNYKSLQAAVDDGLALTMIAEAIADLEAEKGSLHRDENERGL